MDPSSWYLGRRFTRALRRGVDAREAGLFARVEPEMRRIARQAYRESADFRVDQAARFHVRMAALVLGAYRALRGRMADAERVELLNDALLEAYRAPVAGPYRLFLRLSKDPLGRLTRMAERGGINRMLFGRGFTITHRTAPGTLEVVFERCLYHRFFLHHGTPELTSVICHSDHAWIDVIEPRLHQLAFERPGTLGWGAPECVFRFSRPPSSGAGVEPESEREMSALSPR